MSFSPHRRAEAGLDYSRGHAVYSYVTVSELRSQRLGQTQQGCLTHAVRTQSLQRHENVADKNVHFKCTSVWVHRMKTKLYSCLLKKYLFVDATFSVSVLINRLLLFLILCDEAKDNFPYLITHYSVVGH